MALATSAGQFAGTVTTKSQAQALGVPPMKPSFILECACSQRQRKKSATISSACFRAAFARVLGAVVEVGGPQFRKFVARREEEELEEPDGLATGKQRWLKHFVTPYHLLVEASGVAVTYG